jgi:hypothetical protein
LLTDGRLGKLIDQYATATTQHATPSTETSPAEAPPEDVSDPDDTLYGPDAANYNDGEVVDFPFLTGSVPPAYLEDAPAEVRERAVYNSKTTLYVDPVTGVSYEDGF